VDLSDSVKDETQRQLFIINAHPRTHQVRTTAIYIILDGMHHQALKTGIPRFTFPMPCANTAAIVTVLAPVGHSHTRIDNVFRRIDLRLKYGALTRSKL
jgi:hypothetical protein